MANLIQNPTFGNWQHIRYFTDQENKIGTIEAPTHWDFVYIPKESDPNKIPQSLHRDNGFVISAGYRAWEAGYKQHNLPLQAGQRYQLKARIKADVNFPGGQNPDRTAITWRFTVESDKGALQPDWAITSHQQTKQIEDFTYIFDVEEDMTAAITFWGRSFYAGNDCDFWMYEVTLEPVAKNNAIVDKIGSVNATPPAIDPTPIIEPDPTPPENPQAMDKSLGDVTLSVAEVDLIADALRTLAKGAADANTSAGLNKLAEVLERLK